MRFKEPYKGWELEFQLVPVEKIRIPSIQRELSDMHIKRLVESIEKVGFIEPITLVPAQEEGYYEVINGQHRLEAAKILGIRELPAIILPSSAKNYIIALNTEKVPSLKDRAHQAYEIFMDHLKANPDTKEYELEPMVEDAYLLTIGFVVDHFKDKKFPGYAFEKILKKVDFFLNDPLSAAKEERQKRAEVLLKAKEILNRRYEELQLKNPLQKEAIVSKAFQEVYGRYVRVVGDDFYEVFDKLIEAMQRITFEEGELQEL
ncbi:ParB domain protein nuclease [Thermocrinis albus DSM 14484]|uniref:ParB domain protein nuclease n=1 Tax=Thermocrinis albus (strain DSM 14484 / JCM 11386 / HI 11/12) TaxID=638303 RepID=D3SNF4_THEAH|nr:ParB/RepB/Spo0J family partition protein [Thermocrinis albus]ADC88691.1 ParB domain protein nuclease [Thermocrinis albus DSM 14484]